MIFFWHVMMCLGQNLFSFLPFSVIQSLSYFTVLSLEVHALIFQQGDP